MADIITDAIARATRRATVGRVIGAPAPAVDPVTQPAEWVTQLIDAGLDDLGVRSRYVAGSGRIIRGEVVGHSYMAVSWVPDALALGRGLDQLLNLAVGATQVQGYAQTLLNHETGALRRPAGEALKQLGIVMHGINDIAFGGPLGVGFDAAMRAVLSAMRANPGYFLTPSNSAFTYSPAHWNGPYAPLGPGVFYSTTNGCSVKWTSTPGWPGSWVGFHFYNGAQGWGAVHTCTLNGAAAGALDTRDSTPIGAGVRAHRVYVPPGAGHEVVFTVSDIITATYFWGATYERVSPPLIMLLKQPRLPDYSAYAGFHAVPTDADVLAANLRLDAIADEFGPFVQTVDLDAAFGKDPGAFNPDKLHPNHPLGTDLIVAATWAALDASGVAHDRPTA